MKDFLQEAVEERERIVSLALEAERSRNLWFGVCSRMATSMEPVLVARSKFLEKKLREDLQRSNSYACGVISALNLIILFSNWSDI